MLQAETEKAMELSTLWACPHDGQGLRAGAGSWSCDSCRRVYPLVDGIPCFATFEQMAEPQKFEREYRDRWLDYRGDRRWRYDERIEIEAVMSRLRLSASDWVLDAGCGVGRITYPLLETGATVVALDFSLARLQHLRRHAPAAGRLVVALADVTRLPLAAGTFSAAVNTQVLEHLPAPEARRALLDGLFRCLRPGGELLLTVYNFHEGMRHRDEPQEGRHETGIFYHSYQAEELRRELDDFEVAELCGVINRLPYTHRIFPLLGPAARRLDHAAERRHRLSHKWGHLLLAQARRPASDARVRQSARPAHW